MGESELESVATPLYLRLSLQLIIVQRIIIPVA